MLNKRVLVLIPNLGTGGAQKVFRQQLEFLSRHYVVFACVFNWDGAFDSDRAGNLYSLDVPAGKNVVLKIYFFFLRIIRLAQLKRNLAIDVTISHLEGADYVNLFSRRSDKIICWIHGTKKFDANIDGWIGWLRKSILIPFSYKGADKIVAVSDGIRDELANEYKIASSSVVTIYNGFDNLSISRLKNQELSSELNSLLKEKTLIIHCRLAIQKNLSALLRVFHTVQKNDHAIRLVILGDGELRNSLLSESRDLNLRTYDPWSGMDWDGNYNVYFLGYQSNPYPYLSRATLYVMTSGWEGFPLSLCEAMACGLPVVSTDCFTGPREILAPSLKAVGAIQDVVKGEYGFLFPLIAPKSDNDVRYWALHLQMVLNDVESLEYYAKAGVGRVGHFELAVSMASTRKLIDAF